MNTSKINVSVIIVNYNTHKLLEQCLSSIFQQTRGCNYEVIVVDNNSSDDSHSVASLFPVKWIQSPENLGFGKANNLGVQHASGEYLFFLNSDTILTNDAISEFYDFAINNRGIKFGAIGCRLTGTDGNYTMSFGQFPSIRFEWEYLLGKLRKNSESTDDKESAKEVDFVTGADLFISKQLFDEIGGFDPNIFMYYEETDLQYRLNKKGYRQFVIPGPSIIHLEGGSFEHKGLSFNRFMMSQRSYNYYVSKHFKGFHKYWYKLNLCLIRLTIFANNWSMTQKLKAYGLVLTGKTS